MINFDDVTGENKRMESKSAWNSWSFIHSINIIWGSGLRKTNSLLDLIRHQPDIDLY